MSNEDFVFNRELAELLNRHSMECGSQTPDYILSGYLRMCLLAFDQATKSRDAFYEFDPHRGEVVRADESVPVNRAVFIDNAYRERTKDLGTFSLILFGIATFLSKWAVILGGRPFVMFSCDLVRRADQEALENGRRH